MHKASYCVRPTRKARIWHPMPDLTWAAATQKTVTGKCDYRYVFFIESLIMLLHDSFRESREMETTGLSGFLGYAVALGVGVMCLWLSFTLFRSHPGPRRPCR